MNFLHNKYYKDNPAFKPDQTVISRLWQYLKPYKVFIFLSIFLLILAKAVEASIPLFVGYLAQVTIDGIAESDLMRKEILNQVVSISLWLLLFLFFGYLFDTVSLIIKNWIGQKVIYNIRTEIFNHIQYLPLKYFDQNSIGRIITRTIHDVDQINQMFTESVIPILGSLILFISIFFGLAFIEWQMALIFIILFPFIVWLTYRFRKNQRYGYRIVRNIITAMNVFVQEHLMGASIIRNFGLQKKERRQFNEINQDHLQANFFVIEQFAFFMSGIDLLQNFALILGFITLVTFVPQSESFHAGVFFTFSLYTLMIFRPLADLAERYNILQSALTAAEKVFHVFDEEIELANIFGKAEKLELKSIEFEEVWFSYDDQNWILKGLNFEIKKGESIAIIGTTGTGKSTILSLLLRFYDFQKGSIRVNGRDIREYPLQTLRNLFGVVLQDPVIFSGTLYDNISLYDREITVPDVNKTIDYLQMNYLVSQFPNGLMEKMSERGESLSMGEKQLVSFARAVCHEKEVLILDEATSNIDSFTETITQQALKKILEHKTAIVIAHRLSTIKDVTKILVLHEGVLAEMGTHAQLLRKKGIYEKLYRVQFNDS